MDFQIEIEIQDNRNIVHRVAVSIPENATGKKLIETLRPELFYIMGNDEYIALVEWNNQRPQDSLLSEGSKVILRRKPSKDLVGFDGRKNFPLAGDSTTDAPLIDVKKIKPKGK